MQARAATSKAARPNRIQQARFDAYGNQWLAIAGVCPVPNVLNKSQMFFCKKFGYGRIRRALFERQNLHPGEFCKGNWGFGNRLPENCDLRRRNGRPETEGIKNEHLASTKRSFVIYILAQQPGLVGWAELQKMVK